MSELDGVGWYPFKAGNTIGETGSEDGLILRDEEYRAGARITLERDSRWMPFAITCGIYGWMLHTRFFPTEQTASEAFEAMKAGLARIYDRIPWPDDPQADERVAAVVDGIATFVATFP